MASQKLWEEESATFPSGFLGGEGHSSALSMNTVSGDDKLNPMEISSDEGHDTTADAQVADAESIPDNVSSEVQIEVSNKAC